MRTVIVSGRLLPTNRARPSGSGPVLPAQALVEDERGVVADKAADLEGWKSVRWETGKK